MHNCEVRKPISKVCIRPTENVVRGLILYDFETLMSCLREERSLLVFVNRLRNVLSSSEIEAY
jgi:hypothetical protein